MAVILDESGASLLDESGALIYDEAGAPAGGSATGKQSGLGDDFYCGGYHIGGDIRDLAVDGGPGLLDVTHITQRARTRVGGLRDGHMTLTSYMDTAAGQSHATFSPLPRAGTIMTYLRGQVTGNPAACLNAKQVGYDPTRSPSGDLAFKVDGEGDAYGLEWGIQLTDSLRTDAAATNGTIFDNGQAYGYGAQAYLHAVSLTGSAAVTIQHSPDMATWTTLAAFAAIALAPAAQRVAVTGTVNRYLRAATSGTFASFSFQCSAMVNEMAVTF